MLNLKRREGSNVPRRSSDRRRDMVDLVYDLSLLIVIILSFLMAVVPLIAKVHSLLGL